LALAAAHAAVAPSSSTGQVRAASAATDAHGPTQPARGPVGFLASLGVLPAPARPRNLLQVLDEGLTSLYGTDYAPRLIPAANARSTLELTFGITREQTDTLLRETRTT